MKSQESAKQMLEQGAKGLTAAAEPGPFSSYELIDMAEQTLYDLQEVIALYNDEALLSQMSSLGFDDSQGYFTAENTVQYASL